MIRVLHNCAAPAKLNLFLHVIGRRADGYHLLQSVFQLLSRCDMLHFALREDDRICRACDVPGVLPENDLTVRAAHLLRGAIVNRTGRFLSGVDIAIDKNLPMGGGLGGGSSDAATTLMALNYLWQGKFSRAELMQLGARLGADVPFFIFGRNAFVEGIGEKMQAISIPQRWFVVLEPNVAIPTGQIFSDPCLTRGTKPVKMPDFSHALDCFGKNDLQAVAEKHYPAVADAVFWLQQFGKARMTGSGSCVFSSFVEENEADAVLREVPKEASWKAWKAASCAHHPLFGMQV